MGSATTNGGAGGRVPSSPSTLEAMDQSDDEEEDEDLRGRWGNNGVVVAGEGKRGDVKPGIHVSFFFFFFSCGCTGGGLRFQEVSRFKTHRFKTYLDLRQTLIQEKQGFQRKPMNTDLRAMLIESPI